MESAVLLSNATTLMVLGMGTVFVFLTLLVLLTSLMSTLVNRYVPQPVPLQPDANTLPPSADQTLLAVISAAIHAHRSRS